MMETVERTLKDIAPELIPDNIKAIWRKEIANKIIDRIGWINFMATAMPQIRQMIHPNLSRWMEDRIRREEE